MLKDGRSYLKINSNGHTSEKATTSQLFQSLTSNMKEDRNIYRVQKGENYSLYTKNGKKHNLNGPALTIESDEYYYVKGERYTWSQWTDYVALYASYEESPDIERECFVKASNSPDGIYVEMNTKICNTD